jgi:hypothetical protein
VKVQSERGVDLIVDLFREDLIAASLANRQQQIRHRERIQSPVVPKFRAIANRCHNELTLAAMTAAPRKRTIRTKWPPGLQMISIHDCSPRGSRNRQEPPETGNSGSQTPTNSVRESPRNASARHAGSRRWKSDTHQFPPIPFRSRRGMLALVTPAHDAGAGTIRARVRLLRT